MKTIALALIVLGAAACASQTSLSGDVRVPAATLATLVTCESVNDGRQTCGVDARDRMVVVNQQLSDSPCVLGRSWGLSPDRNAIWVDNGCRAEFQVGGSAVAQGAFGRSLVCESENGRRISCPVDTSYGVQLARQISTSGCVRGTDWGFDENGIWVDHGCRAEFVLGGDTRFTPMTGTTRRRLVCESRNDDMNRCVVDTYYGVALARQISQSICVRGVTWGYDAHGIWVTRGCRAEFVLGQ